ncbi:MAG: GntR family transcriptional regulator [Lachnospiraceae bacterium]|nr:GntR family transcriptional regulator [Lachnospiraceae bacterium]
MEEYQEYSLSGRVFHKLRDDILKGKYKEQDELRETTLGEELGVSRTPVREALRQLELEGLVKIVPNKGAYVTGITGKDVKDIYIIRSMLEGLCARWATENITKEQIGELEETILLAEFHSHKDSSEHVVELDGKFHKILYEASNSRILEHVLSDFHKYVQPSRTSSVKTEERANKSIAEHKSILNAIKQKDSELAETLANQHILNVMINLQKQGYKKAEEDISKWVK